MVMSKQIIVYNNFNKGINNSASLDSLYPEELKDAINVDLMMRGGYSRRKGCIRAIPNPIGLSKVTKIIDYPGKPLATVGTNLVDWQGNVIQGGLNTEDIGWEFFTNKKLYFVDGLKYYVYDGTTCAEVTPASGADLTKVKKCKFLIQRGQRMFAWGNPDKPNYLYFSQPGEANNFLASSAVTAITDDIYSLSGGSVFHRSLIMFKNNSVFSWSGWDPTNDVTFDEIDVHDGTKAPGSICKAENYLLYLGDDAIIALVGTDTTQINTMRVSPGITQTLRTITNHETAVGVYYKGCYYLACCTDGTGVNNIILKGHVSMAYNAFDDESSWQRVFPWTIMEGWKVSQWLKGSDGKLYFGSYNGIIYEAFNGLTDDGVAISSRVVHRLNLDDSFRVKKLKKILLLAKQIEEASCSLDIDLTLGYLTLSKHVDLDESLKWDGSDWDEAFWDWTDIVKKEVLIGKKCDRLELTVSHSNLGETFEMYGYAAVYKPKKAKGVRTGVTDK